MVCRDRSRESEEKEDQEKEVVWIKVAKKKTTKEKPNKKRRVKQQVKMLRKKQSPAVRTSREVSKPLTLMKTMTVWSMKMCQSCGKKYDEDDEQLQDTWIGCNHCWRWYHFPCVDILVKATEEHFLMLLQVLSL